ncbi:hypothetical protein [Flavobacterium sp.]|uniref:hypothetical protein n=1 Tax=Flavobacterium sp. TaxID=239 RepID=UPI0022BB7500|nr:hypothetical protein [Flavobacterium sp.]MCZ8168769.1 hypothetical protein [Flavobacterium sp.]
MSTKLIVGSLGLTSTQVVQTVPTDGTPTSEIIKIVVQLVIGIATLVGLFKKPKTPKN